MNLDFNWIVPIIAIGTILVNLGINIAAQRSVSRSVDKISALIDLLDTAREKHSVQIAEMSAILKGVEDWVKSLRRHLQAVNVALQKIENRITSLEESTSARRRNRGMDEH